MSKRSARVESHITQEEKQHISSLARRARISESELVRRVLLGLKLPTPGRYEAVKGLVKINADLARLGNLLKTALNDERADSDKVNALIDALRNDRLRLKTVINTFNDHRKT
jgi:hypothetical protein